MQLVGQSTWVRAVIAVLASASLALGGLPSAAAAGLETSTRAGLAQDETPVAGLMVQYADGVSKIAPNGQITSANFSSVSIRSTVGLWDGLHALTFEQPVSRAKAEAVKTQLMLDKRVVSVTLDELLGQQSRAVAAAVQAFRKASAVREARAVSAPPANDLESPQLQLNWWAPLVLGSGKLVGYRVRQSEDGLSWRVIVSNTANKRTSLLTSRGLVAGTASFFQIAALTETAAGSIRRGAWSATVKGIPRTAPQGPILLGSGTLTGGVAGASVSQPFSPQTLPQRGGLATGYVGLAFGPGGEPITGACTNSNCTFSGLQEGTSYQIEVSARNRISEAQSKPPVQVSDPDFARQWYLSSERGIDVPRAWNLSRGRAAVVVAILDGGITDHPEFAGRVLPGYDFVADAENSGDGDGRDADASDPGDFEGPSASTWHGTHITGIIGAANDGVGTTGVAPQTSLLPLRILGTDGGKKSDLIAAMRWAAGLSVDGVPANQNPARVVNLSLGSKGVSCDTAPGGSQATINELVALGITVVTAAGNDAGSAEDSYPGNCSGVINVTALGYSSDLASYANTGEAVDIAAPGGNYQPSGGGLSFGTMYSTTNLGLTNPGASGYGIKQGTSMAAPVVSGVVALMYALRPAITPSQVLQALRATASAFPAGSNCEASGGCGTGIVNAAAVLARIAATLPRN